MKSPKPPNITQQIGSLRGSYCLLKFRDGRVRELEEKYAKKEATGFDLALVHAALANDDEAIAWLEKDFAGCNIRGLVYVASTIIHQRLRNDPRYQDLLQPMHLRV